jgi:hypothetical protein
MDDRTDLNRRDFHRLTMAAFGGALAGTMTGCGEDKPAAPATAPKGQSSAATDAAAGTEVAASNKEVHLCRGLNSCKGNGADGKNDCAGHGTCATAKHHACGGENECKGLGGCGDDVGQNECKGKGGCHVPLMEFAWEKARKNFEAKMKAADKPFGEAPPAKK